MDFNVNQWLQNKYYGTPYMPTNFQELLFLMRIQFLKYYNSIGFEVQTQFQQRYLGHDYWGLLYFLKDWIFIIVIYHYLVRLYYIVYGYGVFGSIKRGIDTGLKGFFQLLLSLPPMKGQVVRELSKTVDKINSSIILNDDKLLQFPNLPKQGLNNQEILEELNNLQTLKHSDWNRGRVSGAVYHGGSELLELQSDAYHKYSIANQLHPDVFPGIRKMESEVVSMVLKLFNAPIDTGCGSTTSGGTESLLLTGLAAREYGKRKKGITKPEVIAPVTVHAGIEKACYYFGMTLHKVDLDPKSFKVDLNKVKRFINKNTVLLVGSAPNYPHGIIDDIEGLSKLAVKYDIPLHVDACLGSFIVTFLERANIHQSTKIPLFDFRLEGVTSISCDTHKYGFAPKGSSIIMYRDHELRQCQYYISSDWTGGMYGSPTLAGSRPGALMAGCWATLVNIGEDGYTKSCKDIVGATMKLKDTISTHPLLSKNLQVIGDPIASVVAFKSKNKSLSIYEVGDLLTAKGWHFASLQNPAALHFALTRLTVPIIDELIADLITATKTAEQSDTTTQGETASLYGVAGSVKTSGVADKIIVAFLDALYKL